MFEHRTVLKFKLFHQIFQGSTNTQNAVTILKIKLSSQGMQLKKMDASTAVLWSMLYHVVPYNANPLHSTDSNILKLFCT